MFELKSDPYDLYVYMFVVFETFYKLCVASSSAAGVFFLTQGIPGFVELSFP